MPIKEQYKMEKVISDLVAALNALRLEEAGLRGDIDLLLQEGISGDIDLLTKGLEDLRRGIDILTQGLEGVITQGSEGVSEGVLVTQGLEGVSGGIGLVTQGLEGVRSDANFEDNVLHNDIWRQYLLSRSSKQC